jgi:hypothetical protein
VNIFNQNQLLTMKTTYIRLLSLAIAIALAPIIFIACQKEQSTENNPNDNGENKLMLYLTDAPCQFDSVLIDIRYVEVKIDTTNHHDDEQDDDKDDDHTDRDKYGKWDTLQVNAGVYNLLSLRNGVDTLLASGNITAGDIKKIRLTLGTDNSIVTGGISHQLSIHPGHNSYVYVKVKNGDWDDIETGKLGMWMDFDVCRSIVERNGQYFLKPLIRPFSKKNYGEIEGRVLPDEADAIVKIYNTQDTAVADPEDHDGRFKVRGLKEGVYSVLFQASNGYRDTTITNVQVKKNRETKLGTITLEK